MRLGFELEASEIIPNLWQGSFPNLLTASEHKFDFVVMCAQELLRTERPELREQHGMTIFEAPFDDTPWPTAEELSIARWAAAKVIAAHNNGKKVLVTCHAGLNRSGLVCALSLRHIRKLTGPEAVTLVKGSREGALCNPAFAMYVYNLKSAP